MLESNGTRTCPSAAPDSPLVIRPARPWLVPAVVLTFFLLAGAVTSVLRHNALYLLLFVTVGGMPVAGVAVERSARSPRARRAVRILTMWGFAGCSAG